MRLARLPLLPVALLAAASAACGGGSSPPPPPPPLCSLPTPQPSALPAAQVIELGSHAVGSTVTFSVPPGTGSVTILQQGTQPQVAPTITYKGQLLQNTVVPWTVSVGGTKFYDDGVVPPADPATWNVPYSTGVGGIYFGTAAPWTGSMTVPNTSQMLSYVAAHGGVPSGTWSVVVNDYAYECKGTSGCKLGDGKSSYPDGSYDVTVLLRPGAVAATGTMDVTFYLVTDTLTETSAPADPSVQRMLQTLGTFLGNAGIAVGTVRFVDLPATVKAKYATGVNADDGSPCGEISQLLQLSGAGNAMNLFLVNSLVSAQGGGVTVVGVDGTIPGPSSVGGTVASGALVSVADLTHGAGSASCSGAWTFACGADSTAYVAAHETGHFLGLYHVTESYGDLFDPVADTATCPCSTCAPQAQRSTCVAAGQTGSSSNYQVTGSDCTKGPSCGGGDNLMFWLLSSASKGSLSLDQSSILRANALVR